MEKRYKAKINVVVWRQAEKENSSLPVAVRVSKTRVLKVPIPSPLCDGHPNGNFNSLRSGSSLFAGRARKTGEKRMLAGESEFTAKGKPHM